MGICHRLESCFWQSLRNDEFDGFDTSNESMSFLVIIVLFVGLVEFNTCVTFCVYVINNKFILLKGRFVSLLMNIPPESAQICAHTA